MKVRGGLQRSRRTTEDLETSLTSCRCIAPSVLPGLQVDLVLGVLIVTSARLRCMTTVISEAVEEYGCASCPQ